MTKQKVAVWIVFGLVFLGVSREIRSDDLQIKTSAVLQSWLVNDTTVAPAKPNFRIRRAEIKVNADFGNDARGFVMFDPAKSPAVGTPATNDNKILQDIGVEFEIVPGLELVAGQFKIQTAAEGLQRSSDLLFPERSIVGRTY